MKKLIIVLSVVVVAIAGAAINLRTVAPSNVGEAPGLIAPGYMLINSATSDDTDLTTTTKDWTAIADVDTPGPFVRLPRGWKYVEFSVYGYGDGDGVGSPNNGTCTVIIYACRPYGNARKVYEGAVTIGAQQMSVNPVGGSAFRTSQAVDPNNCWADTIDPNGTGAEWASEVHVAGNDGNDGVAIMTTNTNGYIGWYAIIKDITNLSAVYVVASGSTD